MSNEDKFTDYFNRWLLDPVNTPDELRFSVRNGELYYQSLTLIPFARFTARGELFIRFHRTLKKPLVHFVVSLPRLKIKRWFFVHHFHPEKVNLSKKEIDRDNLWNMLGVFMEFGMYHALTPHIRIIDSLNNYITRFRCDNTFKDLMKKEIKMLRNSNWYDYFSDSKIYKICRNICDDTANIERQMRLLRLVNKYK